MREQIISRITAALEVLSISPIEVIVQAPKHPDHGDLSSNIAMMLARTLKTAPIEIAGKLQEELIRQDTEGFFTSVDVAMPGFLNFRINRQFYTRQLSEIVAGKDGFGRSDRGAGRKAIVEFVSANPTGPLTVGHGRGAMLGDTVSNILEWNGYQVTREYYFNNAGRQMRVLGQSVYARYAQICGAAVDFPDEGYQGEYIREIADKIHRDSGDNYLEKPDDPIFRGTAESIIFDDIKGTLADLGLVFDSFFNEQQVYDNNAIFDLVETLRGKNLIYQKDDATWFRATAVGRDMDKVLIKSTGEPTYRLPDMAYHLTKYERGFDLIVDVFGADHIDTYPDILTLLEIMGCEPKKMEVLIHQFVTILKAGEQVKMSTRKANYITLDELIREVGADVVRFFFIMRGMSTHLNFDMDLAKDQSDDNPVFYLQYAHARVCNILKRAEAFGMTVDPSAKLDLIQSEIELRLVQKMLEFPDLVRKLADTLEPQQLANYLGDLAAIFHKFYAHEKVISDDKPLSAARLVLTDAFRIVMANGLSILGIRAPERM